MDKPPNHPGKRSQAQEVTSCRTPFTRNVQSGGRGGWSTEAESSPAVARGLEGGWGGTADGHRVYFREMKMTQN